MKALVQRDLADHRLAIPLGAAAGLIPHVLIAKYKYHLPLHRQICIFARHGSEIAESTLCDWVKDAAELLQPVVFAVKVSALASHAVQKRRHRDHGPGQGHHSRQPPELPMGLCR